jgi:D-beta-D-heptose 7-phosphate kinase / D-beta-D-heptose 1-phosphate adenosyltransferase
MAQADSSPSSQRTLDVVRGGFGQVPVLVVGDLILDRYAWGEVTRISPEAPVPVVRWQRQTERLGGAANVAANLTGLGAQVTVAGFVGADAEGTQLLHLLSLLPAATEGVVRQPDRPTTTKTRVIGGHQQMLRLDREDDRPAAADDEAHLLAAVGRALEARPVAVILSDYAKGVVGERVAQAVMEQARRLAIPVFVDPKGRDYSKYRGATALTPNRAELALACGVASEPVEPLLRSGAKLRQDLDLGFLVVTRGEEGITLIEPETVSHVPAVAQRVFDVSGAGDTVIATLTAGIAVGLSLLEAIYLANLAAGIVVGKVGTVPVDRAGLLEALSVEAALRHAPGSTSVTPPRFG